MKKIALPLMMVLAAVLIGCDNQLASLLSQAAAASAVVAAAGATSMDSTMDSDGDGLVSKDEWTASNTALFAKIDVNGNGVLSADELKAGGRPGPGPMQPPIDSMDTDKDGAVSSDEWNAFHDKVFSEIDATGDGFLSKDELEAHRRSCSPAGGPPIGLMDADKNGNVSQAEWTSFHAALFSRADADGNGYLSEAEQKAMVAGPAAPPFNKMDGDGDGAVSENEWSNYHVSVFLEMDKDGDGSLAVERPVIR